MRTKFVETSNVKRFHSALNGLERRGAGEACLMVVDGVPGLGKTTTLQHWAIRNQCIYIRAKRKWKASWMLNELLEEMRVTPPHRIEDKYKQALNHIGQRQDRAAFDEQVFAIVIDEADFISKNEECVEAMRDLSDMLEVPVIFVGMGRIRNNLTRFPQIASRVSEYVEFTLASEADVRAMADELCEVTVSDDMVKFIHKVSGGYNREIMECLSRVERFGLRNLEGDRALTMHDMSGQVITKERKTSRDIIVPEVL